VATQLQIPACRGTAPDQRANKNPRSRGIDLIEYPSNTLALSCGRSWRGGGESQRRDKGELSA